MGVPILYDGGCQHKWRIVWEEEPCQAQGGDGQPIPGEERIGGRVAEVCDQEACTAFRLSLPSIGEFLRYTFDHPSELAGEGRVISEIITGEPSSPDKGVLVVCSMSIMSEVHSWERWACSTDG